MLGSSPLIAFLATTNAEHAKAFYSDVLGLTLEADEPFALVFDAHGTMLRIARVRELSPAPFTVLGWVVPNIITSIEQMTTRGITLERFPGLPQDERGVCTFPDGTAVAWFKDPDGNLLSITQFADQR